jgi:hypothetical protein
MDLTNKSKTYNARRERFLKAKNIRLEKLHKSLESIRKLSIKSNHAYTDEDVEEITKTLSKGIYSVIHKFSSTADNRLKHYLEAEEEHYKYLYENDRELFNLIKLKTPHLVKYFDKIEIQVDSQISSLDGDITKIKESLKKSQDQLRLVIDHLDGRDD